MEMPYDWRFIIKLPSGSVICFIDAICQKQNLSEAGVRTDGADEPKLTEAQRRFALKLLAQQGFEPEAAENRLKERFKVASLTDIPRNAASKYIEQLVAETKAAGSNES